ncbi:MAG: hypothetical protein M1816_003144 [Peltula sp. TS41687]|nr:MAG: hypothetical protein M1816_003144 [Peltula sp. TS41687]
MNPISTGKTVYGENDQDDITPMGQSTFSSISTQVQWRRQMTEPEAMQDEHLSPSPSSPDLRPAPLLVVQKRSVDVTADEKAPSHKIQKRTTPLDNMSPADRQKISWGTIDMKLKMEQEGQPIGWCEATCIVYHVVHDGENLAVNDISIMRVQERCEETCNSKEGDADYELKLQFKRLENILIPLYPQLKAMRRWASDDSVEHEDDKGTEPNFSRQGGTSAGNLAEKLRGGMMSRIGNAAEKMGGAWRKAEENSHHLQGGVPFGGKFFSGIRPAIAPPLGGGLRI